MGLATIQFLSTSLYRDVTYSVILPDTGQAPFPVLMQLHGAYSGHTAWLYHGSLLRLARDCPLLIVLPDGGSSAYLNLELGVDPTGSLGIQRYEDFLLRDLREHVARTFQVRAGPWAIGGLSMGGYGAMRLGCKYPDHFASIWAHSGAYYTRDEMVGYYPDPDDADVYAHIARLSRAARRPEISFDCGVDDPLIDHNRRLHAHLAAASIPHHYAEHPGGHTWDYWNEHVQAALQQHVRVLDHLQ